MKSTVLILLSLLFFNCQSQSTLERCKQLYEMDKQAQREFVNHQMGLASDTTKFYNQICHCEYVEFWSDGQLAKKGIIQKCEKEGKWITYGKDEHVINITNYKSGKRHGEFKSFRGNSFIALHCFYREDEFHGPYKKYDDKGNLKKHIIYDMGKVSQIIKNEEWETDGVIRYEWPDMPKAMRSKKEAGVYIWNNGELIPLRQFDSVELKTREPNLDLNKRAKESLKSRNN